MRKILYIDNWDRGYRNFLRLDSKFKEKGYETLLVHTTSWIDDEVTVEKEIEGMKMRDISYYKSIRIRSVIESEKPSAVILLNLSFIIDRAIVKICKDLGVNVYYLAHGKLFTPESQKTIKKNIEDIGGDKLAKKISKKNLIAVYNYFVEMKSISKVFKFLYKAKKDFTQFTAFPKYSDELKVNKCFVYYPIDLDVMVNEFGFPKENINVVGNPELDEFYNATILNIEDYCAKELKIKGTKYIAYIDDGLSSLRNWDNKKWVEFIDDLNEIHIENGLELVIKLHPRRVLDADTIAYFEEKGIKYLKDVDFRNYIQHANFVISHFSSVVIYGLLLNKNIKSPRWGLSEGLEENFPHSVVNYYYEKKAYENSISNLDVDISANKEYLADTISTNFDGKCIDRIVSSVLNDLN